MTYLTKKLGNNGEDLAIQFLIEHKFTIIERNYRFGKGEIDIIARDSGDVLVFVEVKTRMNDNYGDPEFSITKGKQRQIIKTAEGYLYERNITDTSCRFDVITIRFDTGDEPRIDYFEHAFMK